VRSKKAQEKFKLEKTKKAKLKKEEFETAIKDRAERVEALSKPRAPGSDVTE